MGRPPCKISRKGAEEESSRRVSSFLRAALFDLLFVASVLVSSLFSNDKSRRDVKSGTQRRREREDKSDEKRES